MVKEQLNRMAKQEQVPEEELQQKTCELLEILVDKMQEQDD